MLMEGLYITSIFREADLKYIQKNRNILKKHSLNIPNINLLKPNIYIWIIWYIDIFFAGLVKICCCILGSDSILFLEPGWQQHIGQLIADIKPVFAAVTGRGDNPNYTTISWTVWTQLNT